MSYEKLLFVVSVCCCLVGLHKVLMSHPDCYVGVDLIHWGMLWLGNIVTSCLTVNICVYFVGITKQLFPCM